MKKIADRITRALAHPLMKNSAIVFAGTMVANVFSYAYHLVVGRLLGPEQYGAMASLFSFSYLLNVPSLVLQTVLTKYFSEFRSANELGKAKTLSLTASKYLIGITILGAVIMLPFIPILSDFLHIDTPAVIFLTYVTSALWLFIVVQMSILQGFQRFMSAMVLTNVSVASRLIGGIVGGMLGFIETVIAGTVTAVLGLIVYVIPLSFIYRVKPVPTGLTKKAMFSYSWPSFITMLGITSLYSTDIMLAKHYLPATEAGYYAALSVMGKIIYFASSSISYVVFPVVAERTKQKENSSKIVFMALAVVGAVSAAITAGYALLPELSLSLLFGPTYSGASGYLWLFGAFLSLYSLSYLLVMTLLGSGRMLVWIFVGIAAVIQILGISIFHGSIQAILYANLSVTLGLFLGLLVYYRHARKEG